MTIENGIVCSRHASARASTRRDLTTYEQSTKGTVDVVQKRCKRRTNDVRNATVRRPYASCSGFIEGNRPAQRGAALTNSRAFKAYGDDDSKSSVRVGKNALYAHQVANGSTVRGGVYCTRT